MIEVLSTFRGRGKVFPDKRLDLKYSAIAKASGVTWKHNALRHRALTRQMLLSATPAEVANNADSSIQTIESNDRNRGATKDEAISWFNLRPQVEWGFAVQPSKN